MARRSNQSILKEISPEYSLEGLILKLKLQYFGHLMRRTDSFEKDPDAGKDCKQEENGMTEDEMVGWHHWLNGHGFGWTLGVGDGQGGLVCCSPWGCQESDMNERLNRNWNWKFWPMRCRWKCDTEPSLSLCKRQRTCPSFLSPFYWSLLSPLQECRYNGWSFSNYLEI